jgi:stress response protein SCP2
MFTIKEAYVAIDNQKQDDHKNSVYCWLFNLGFGRGARKTLPDKKEIKDYLHQRTNKNLNRMYFVVECDNRKNNFKVGESFMMTYKEKEEEVETIYKIEKKEENGDILCFYENNLKNGSF